MVGETLVWSDQTDLRRVEYQTKSFKYVSEQITLSSTGVSDPLDSSTGFGWITGGARPNWGAQWDYPVPVTIDKQYSI